MRPVLVLTREAVLPYVTKVTVAPITSTARGVSSELHVGRANGIDHNSVVSCDNVTTIHVDQLGEEIGFLLPWQEPALAEAIASAFGLDVDPAPPAPQSAE